MDVFVVGEKMDISIVINDIKLNVRVGVIFKYNNEVFIELSKIGSNSVIPGGRIKIGEKSIDAIKREIKEELNFDIDVNKLTFVKVIENFFMLDTNKFHELFFVYKYNVSEKEYEVLSNIKNNQDNINSYFEFVNLNNLGNINLLPVEIIELIKDA